MLKPVSMLKENLTSEIPIINHTESINSVIQSFKRKDLLSLSTVRPLPLYFQPNIPQIRCKHSAKRFKKNSQVCQLLPLTLH